jgi:hypothetical protein
MHSNSDGCVMALELKDGIILRDAQNRAVVLSVGLIYGSPESMIKQVSYALDRMKTYDLPNGMCTVIEGNHASFRFPDSNILEIFRLLRTKYKKESNNGVIHFINLSRLHRYGLKFAYHLLPPKIKSQIVIHATISSFQKHFAKGSLLRRWGGNVPFNIDDYVQMRCDIEKCVISETKENMKTEQMRDFKENFSRELKL